MSPFSAHTRARSVLACAAIANTGADCFGVTFLVTAASCGLGAVMALLLGVRSRKRYASPAAPESLLAAARAGETVV